MKNNYFSAAVEARSTPGWTAPIKAKGRREASAAEFYAAMAPRHWKAERSSAAFRVLVSGERIGDVAEALGLTRHNVAQSCGAAYSIIEGWRLKQKALEFHVDAGVAGIVENIHKLLACVNSVGAAVEVGEVRVALRKSAKSLQDAAAELQPYT